MLKKVEDKFIPEFFKFKEKEKSVSPTFLFWDQLLDAIQILLTFIRAERESKWIEHVCSSASMIPYFFVCNRTNNVRYAPLYVLQMLNDLPREAEEEFLLGRHSIKFTPHAFQGLWSDMGVEMSVIKDTKREQSIDGFIHRGDAVLRWILSRSISGVYTKNMKSRCGLENDDDSNFLHEQHQPSCKQQDEKDILLIFNHKKII